MAVALIPHPYQHEDATWACETMAERKAAFIWHPMGLGKSLIAILCADKLIANTILVLCPTVARMNWKREIQRNQKKPRDVWIIGIDGPVVPPRFLGWVILGYERLQERNKDLLRSLQRNFDLCIVDEHHYVANPETQRAEILYKMDVSEDGTIHRLAQWWKACLLMSGTPMRNSAVDLWCHLYVWFPGVIFHNGRRMTRQDMMDAYCKVETRILPNGAAVDVIVGGKNEADLIRRLRGRAPCFRRRRREDVRVSLPALHVMPHVLHSYGLAADRLDDLATSLGIDPLDDDEQAADALDGLGENPGPMSVLQFAALQRCSGVMEIAQEVMATDPVLGDSDRKVLLFAHHHEVMDELTEGLRNLDLGPVTIRGAQTAADRQRAIDAFQTHPGCRSAVVQLQAGGVAINLTSASDVIMAELDWTAANNSQAIARAYRIGQENPVQVRVILGTTQIERAQARIIARRLEHIDRIAPDTVHKALIAALRQEAPVGPPLPFGSTDDWLDGVAAPQPTPNAADWLE